MSYSNPQRIINKEFDVRAKSSRQLQNTIQNTTASIASAVAQQKKQKEELEAANVETESALRDKVNEFATPGAGQIDKSIIEFWDTKIEDYVNNMNLAANGEITQREAMLRNKKIEALLPQFKQNAATLASNAALQKEALNDGTFSSTGSIANKEILNRLGNNGDVRIVEKDGAIYYWAPEKDENGNVIPDSGVMINGAELYANPDKPLFNTKSDISGLITQGWNKFSGEETGISDYVKTIAVKNGDKHPITGETISGLEDGYEQVIRIPVTENRDKYIDEIESSAYFNGILGNEKEMLSVWQDEIPDGEPDENGQYPPNSLGFFASGGDPTLDIDLDAMGLTMDEWQNSVYGEYPDDVTDEQKALIDKNQKAVSKRYMANLSWDQNSLTAGASKTIGKRKISEPATSGGDKSRFTTTQQTVYDNRKDDFIANRDAAEDMYTDGTPDAQTFVTALQNADPTGDYFVNDKGLIQSGNSIISIPNNAKNASVVLNSKSGIDRTMQNVFNKENPYQAAQEEEEVDVNVSSSVPDDATVYRSTATEKKVFDGVLTEDEISLFTKAYPDSEFNSGPMYDEQIKKLSQNPPEGMSRAAYAQSPEVKEKAIRILKRKQAIEDKKDAEASNETLSQYYG